ncbi:DegV family protein [Listeria sp. PSOL-1]|uniref:DegV family protein n=1 Tax=Listeria sp. PSOL-1 TaxID=1844999 RepID=UPI0013D898E1|nr:DegV family protein [Listeria sp. PSOL-1]
MTKIKIITDSTAGITSEEQMKYDITVLPLTVEIDGKNYNAETDLTAESFMSLMEQAKTLPKSSQPAIGHFISTYQKYIDEGYQILSFHLTEHLSGTVNTARQAADIVGGDITVIDTGFIARAQAFQVLEAAKMVGLGTFSMAQIMEKITNIRNKTKLYIVVVTLENLIKGGRIGSLQGLIGSLLNIKLLARLTDGKLQEETKQRSNKKIIQQLLDMVKKEAQEVVACDIVQANGLKSAETLKEQLTAFVHSTDISIFAADPVISTHAGPGAYAIMYYTE